MKKIAIVGGGISGLSIAYFITKKLRERKVQAEIILIEKKDKLGGNITTFSKDSFLIEGGPDCFISEKPWALKLCEELKLGDDLLTTREENKKTFVLKNGKLKELPDGLMLMIPTKIMPFLLTPLISIQGKIRMGLDLFISKKENNEDESLGSFVRRRLGQEALDIIAEPLIAGIHAGDPETMSLKNTFPRFLEMEQNYGSLIKGMLARMKNAPKKSSSNKLTMFMTLKNGLVELIDKIKENLGTSVRIITGKNVNYINKIKIAQEVKYEIQINDNQIEIVDYIIMTTPAYETGRMINKFAPAISAILNDFPYVSTGTVSIGYKRSDIKHPLKGFGFVIPRTEKRKIMATTWTSEKFSNRASNDFVLLRAFIGGVNNPDILNLSDEEIVNIVQEEWGKIMGIKATPVISKVFRWNKAMPQYIIGHELTVKKIDELSAEHKGLIIAGNFMRGVGISDCIFNAETVACNVVENVCRE